MVVLTGIILAVACQKEYSLDSGTATGSSAEGTLKDTLGNCQPIIINGKYIADSTLKDSNYVLIQVNITSVGNYKINTDVQNGYSFRDSGYFSAKGLQTVKLKGFGKPILPIASDFTVSFNNTNCFFRITAPGTPGSGTTAAVFTLAGSPAACSNYIVQGTYKTGTPLSASANTLMLQVNVTTAGSYSITTTTVGGMKFSGSGSFTTTGLQNITLTGSGTPTTAGVNTFPITAGSSNCSFVVNVTAGTGTGGATAEDSAWSFTQGTKFYYGPIDTMLTIVDSGRTFLIFEGSSFPTYDSTLDVIILMPGTTIVAGTYPTTAKTQFEFDDINNKPVYKASPLTPTVNLQIVISSYNATTKIVTGTFEGTVLNAAGTSVPITGGKFKGVVK